MSTTTEFKPGQLVRHKTAFLQSAGWYTNVPRAGIVVAVTITDPQVVTVDWSTEDAPPKILAFNLEHVR